MRRFANFGRLLVAAIAHLLVRSVTDTGRAELARLRPDVRYLKDFVNDNF